MSKFKGLRCFCHELGDSLPAGSTALPTNIAAAVAAQIDIDFCTRITLSGAFGCEVVKLLRKDTGVCIVTRGDEGTAPRDWLKGDKVRFEWTDQSIKDAIACANGQTDNGLLDLIKSDYFELSFNDDGQLCIEPPESEIKDQYGPMEWKSGLYKYFIKDGVICRVALPANEITPDGKYNNVCVTVKDNCYLMEKGDDLAAKSGCGGCCGCKSQAPKEQAAPPATDGTAGYFWWDTATSVMHVLAAGAWRPV